MIDRIINILIFLLVFLLPLFFLPITTDFYVFNKHTLLILLTFLILGLWAAKMVRGKRVSLLKSPFNLPIILFSLSFLASALLSPNKFRTVSSPQGAGAIITLTFLYFIVSNNFKKDLIPRLLTTFIISGVILALSAIFQFFGGGKLLASFPWLWARDWTPVGSLLILGIFLGLVLIILLPRFLKVNIRSSPFLISLVFALFIFWGLGATVFQLLTTSKPVLLPLSFGWAIAVETLKGIRTAFWGVGPGNFWVAFNLFRPIFYNNTSYWNLVFVNSSNWYLNLLTEGGILGLSFYLFLTVAAVKEILKRKVVLTQTQTGLSLSAGLIFLILAQLILPVNLLILFSFFLGLALLNLTLDQEKYEEEAPLLSKIFFSLLAAFVLFTLYWYGRIYVAEVYFKKSLDAARENKGTDTYNLQIKALSLSPYSDSYHASYSQTNIGLANAISTKKDLTDQDRQTISRLIQQAIREGKAAVALNPQSSQAWENLGSIYRSIINAAQGADQWAQIAYQQAIVLDSVNPNLRLALGGIFYSQGKFDEAIQNFQAAAFLKPDFANAHYNLAAAYQEKKDYQKAIQEMQTVLSLVVLDTNDFKRASEEFDNLKKFLPTEASPSVQPETLSTPPAPAAGLEPPLTLPEESSPAGQP